MWSSIKKMLAQTGLQRRSGWGVTLISSALLCALPSQAQLPTLGEGGSMTTGAERRMGDRIARELYRDTDYLDDPVLVEYVQSIWQPLLAAARTRGDLTPELYERFAWKIMLGRDRSVNAFALPGGYFGLHLGLMGVVSSRDELASVLAHEISHVTQRHISRLISQQSQQSPLLLGAMILALLAASKNPQAASAVMVGGQAVAIQSQLNFSRDMEREADRVGYSAMTQAGFAPQGFVTMFEKLQQASRLNDNSAFPYLRSHPMTTERMADMQGRQQLQENANQPVTATLEHAMAAARARVLSGPGAETLRGWVNEAQSSELAKQDLTQRCAVLYAAALASAKLRENASVQGWLASLQTLTREEPRAARLIRLLAIEVQTGAAQAQNAAALATAGTTHWERPELMLAVAGLVKLGRAKEAAQHLQSWLALQPGDSLAWQQLAQAYAAQGQTLSAVRAEAEVRVAQLDYPAALDRFRAAQDLARDSSRRNEAGAHIEASIIDARTRQVQLLFKEQALER
ncbi:MAG: M48 family metalloprotease [Burkholderiaceae bacterium]